MPRANQTKYLKAPRAPKNEEYPRCPPESRKRLALECLQRPAPKCRERFMLRNQEPRLVLMKRGTRAPCAIISFPLRKEPRAPRAKVSNYVKGTRTKKLR
eukprot:910806-Pleurochrysis_carterae.AAC.1